MFSLRCKNGVAAFLFFAFASYAAVAGAVNVTSATGTHTQPQPRETWVSAWTASADTAGPPFKAQTVRQVIRSSIAADGLRIRLSNQLGQQSVHIGSAHVALHAKAAAIVAGSDRVLTFHGKPEVSIKAGQSVLSDPLDMKLNALEELAVSLYFPADTGQSSQHSAGMATAYVTNGDSTAAQDLKDAEITSARYFLSGLDVSTRQHPASTLVVIGDSISDGVGSTQDANLRWPDQLAARLQAEPEYASIAVVNAGIAGNRLLKDAGRVSIGSSMLKRYANDVLDQAGVRHIIVLAGINDIGLATGSAQLQDKVTVSQLIAGMKKLIARAHAKGIRIAGATLTPFAGSEWPFHTREGELQRQALNAWIREAGAFDAVIDFDLALRDPAHPDRFLSEYDSGDHAHPNDAGYKLMAQTVALEWLRRDGHSDVK